MTVALYGCEQLRTEVELHQPFERGCQQVIRLSGADAHYAAGDDGTARLVMEWPLPGSRLGRRCYALYLRFPARVDRHDVPDAAAGESSFGLFIQSVDRLRGATPVAEGFVRLDEVSPPSGEMQLRCADGSEIRGHFVARAGSRRPLVFEREHESDIAAARVSGDGEVARR